LNLFSTAEKHLSRAETRVIQQSLCLSIMSELLADPSQLRDVDDEPIDGFFGWTYSVNTSPTHIEGLSRLRVAVSREHLSDMDRAPIRRNSYELVRWAKLRTAKEEMTGRLLMVDR